MPTALTMRGLCSWTRTRCPRVTSAAITRPSPPHTINDRRCPPPPRPETEPEAEVEAIDPAAEATDPGDAEAQPEPEPEAEAEETASSVTVATSRQTSARSVP